MPLGASFLRAGIACTLLPNLACAVLSTTWQDFLDAQAGGTEAVLPDYSYAGYMRSEVDLPAVAGPVFDVSDYGARANDAKSDRNAIQAAIDAAEAAGGGVVVFPQGRFHLNTWSEPGLPLRIRSGNIVLRGAGPWPGGTELFMEANLEPEDPNELYSTPEIIRIEPTVTSAPVITTVTGSANRGSFSLEVASTASLSVGQWVTLFLSDTDAVAPMLAPKTAAPEWTRLLEDGLQVRERHQIAAIDGTTITFEEPILIGVDSAHDWMITGYSHLQEVGLEGIAFRGNWLGDFVHHRSALDDSGWSCLQINNVVNGWIRNCRFINWNEAINLHDSSLFTILHTRIEGNPGHFGIHTRRGTGVLVALSEDLASQWHGPSVGYQSAGTVFWRYDYPADSSFDGHSTCPYATLLDDVSGGLFGGRTGGPLNGQPNHLRWFTLWNFEHLSNPLVQYNFWPASPTARDRFLYPIIVGFHGTNSSFLEENLAVAEMIGAPVEPESLFLAQLENRLGATPAFFSTWQSDWADWETIPSEIVVRVNSADALEEALESATPGTRIVFEPGIYRNQGLEFDGQRSANGIGGTEDWPIVLCAERAGETVFTGTSTLRIAGQHMWVEDLLFAEGSISSGAVIKFEMDEDNRSHFCRLRNSAIVDYNPGNPDLDYDWVDVSGRFNVIENCAFTGMAHKGVQLVVFLDPEEAPNTPVIRGNYFGQRAPGTGNGFETIRIGTSNNSLLPTNGLVERNLFEECDGEIEIISNKSVGNLYQGNTFRHCDGQLTLRHGAACRVEGNFFLGEHKSGSSGVRIIGPDHVVINNYLHQLRGSSNLRAAITFMNGVPNSPLNRYEPILNALVAHNTIIDCDPAVVIGTESSEGDTTVPPADSVLANNVIVGASSPQVSFINSPTNFTYTRHFYFGADSGLPDGADTVEADPLLAPGLLGLLRPGPGSPLIDAADNSILNAPAYDLDGQLRPDTGRDVGADEVLAEPPIVNWYPLVRDDVGPSWPVIVPDIGGIGPGGFKEGFSYPDGFLRGSGFWADSGTTSTRTQENTDAITVEDQMVRINLDGTADIGSLYSPVIAGAGVASGSLYASLHLMVESLPLEPYAVEYFGGFTSDDGNVFRGRLWITGQDAATQTYQLGVTSKTGSPFAVVSSRVLHLGQWYGVTLSHIFDPASTETRLHIDASSAVDPFIQESSSGGSTLSGFGFRSSAGAIADLRIDNLRVGDEFDEILNPLRDPFGGMPYPAPDHRWFWSPVFGSYYREYTGHLLHPQLGWQWWIPPVEPGGDALVYTYDYATGEWWLTTEGLFPWVYLYGPVAGWYWVAAESTASDRVLIPAP